nr:helix-turn-helix domain-containing protein [Candidatus Burarchaeum sp.]
MTETTMEKSILLSTIGDTPANRIADFFIEGRGIDYTKTDVANACGISRPTAYKLMAVLAKDGFVKKTRTIGRAVLYTLNLENTRVKALMKLETLLLAQSFEEVGAKPKIRTAASA